MLLESSLSAGAPSPTRRWYRPERAPLPAEPGRLLVNALINEQRHAQGRTTAGDDRLEARAYAMKRALWRLAHAERSGHFACSIAQLSVAIAPAAGWDPPPRGRLARERWVRAHRVSVIRWLGWLQAAGVLSYEGERDNRGQLWRTLVTLHRAPEPPGDELDLARRRLRRFRYRAQRRHIARLRRRRRQLRRRPLTPPEAVLSAAVKPQRSTRRRLARQRAFCVNLDRRSAAAADDVRTTKDVTYPFGAPSTTEYQHELRPAQSQQFAAPTSTSSATSADTTGACAHRSSPPKISPGSETAGYRGGRDQPRQVLRGHELDEAGVRHLAEPSQPRSSGPVAVVHTAVNSLADPSWVNEANLRIQEALAATGWRRERAARDARDTGLQLLAEPAGRFPGLGRLRAGWVLFRFGLEIRPGFAEPQSGAEMLGDAGSAAAGAINSGQRDRAAAAIAAYDAHAEYRPLGWPATGTAALCALASQQVARDFHSELGRLEQLTRRMRAAARHADPDTLRRARRRAQRRWPDPSASRGRFGFRQHTSPDQRPRFETAEQRRQRVRDALLLIGEHPGLSPHVFTARHFAAKRHEAGEPTDGDPTDYELPDGLTARAQRYRDELRHLTTWQLPPSWAAIERLAGVAVEELADTVEMPEDWTLR